MQCSFDARTCAGFILIALLVFASVISTPVVFADKPNNGNGNSNNGNNGNGNGSTNGGGNGSGNSNGNGNCNGDGNKNCGGGSTAPTIVNVDVHTETGIVTFSTTTGSFSSYSNIDVESIPQEWGRPSAELLYGLFSFTITSLPVGSTVTVTISFPSDIPAGLEYWKVHDGEWILLPAEFVGSNDGDNILTLTLTDGGIGDDDGVANGVIADPGGPGIGTKDRGAGGCREITITNDPTVYARCTVIDTIPPKIVKTFMTPSGYLCAKTIDDTETIKVTYNGLVIPKWSGSSEHFCTNEALPAIMKIVAEDIAGNTSEMLVIDTQQVEQTRTEEAFTAVVSKELNPHHGIEGITLETTQPVSQIRFANSLEFTDKELHISEKSLLELDGKQTISLTYKGQYGKERHGYVYVFAANNGLLATFDVVVNDDIRLYPHQDKASGSYDLDMRSVSLLDKMNLNAWQKAELESMFAGEFTMSQQNVLSLVLAVLDAAN